MARCSSSRHNVIAHLAFGAWLLATASWLHERGTLHADARGHIPDSAIESPENWFEDFGAAQLIDGVAVVWLDPDFIQTVNAEKDYRVFPVPNGDCRGLYVTNKSANSFEVA